MNSKVCVDTSFVLKLVLPEEHSDAVHLVWSQWIDKKIDIYAPYLLLYEAHSVIRNKVHRKELTLNEGKTAAEVLMEQEIIFYNTPTTVRIACNFARQYNQPTLYDAFYLAVARELESEFWTADKKLFNSISHEITWVRSVFDLRP